MQYLIVVLSSVFAGSVQTLSGFGAAICLMLFLPSWFSIIDSSSISIVICLTLNAIILFHYRKHIRFSRIALPALCFFLTSTVMTKMIAQLESDFLYVIFGIFMILLAIYMFFFSDKLKVSGGPVSAIICSSVAGVTTALFGIGGPMMAAYFLAVFDKKEEYLANSQLLFLFFNCITIISRSCNGLFSTNIVPFILVGIVGIILGNLLGERLRSKISDRVMKFIILLLIAGNGIYVIVTHC